MLRAIVSPYNGSNCSTTAHSHLARRHETTRARSSPRKTWNTRVLSGVSRQLHVGRCAIHPCIGSAREASWQCREASAVHRDATNLWREPVTDPRYLEHALRFRNDLPSQPRSTAQGLLFQSYKSPARRVPWSSPTEYIQTSTKRAQSLYLSTLD